MPTIKFSHRYTKMFGITVNGEKALLLQVFPIDHKDLSNVFIAYDTEISDTKEHYKLPTGKLLVLLFINDNGTVFTTIRRWTPQKAEYYTGLMGKEFEITFV